MGRRGTLGIPTTQLLLWTHQWRPSPPLPSTYTPQLMAPQRSSYPRTKVIRFLSGFVTTLFRQRLFLRGEAPGDALPLHWGSSPGYFRMFCRNLFLKIFLSHCATATVRRRAEFHTNMELDNISIAQLTIKPYVPWDN